MENRIDITAGNTIANELNIMNLVELLQELGIEAEMCVGQEQITMQVSYTRDQITNIRKRHAGRKVKLTDNLTYGDVEQLLETTSVEDIAKLAKISRATCYRRIRKLRQYQEESHKSGALFGEIYKGYNF